MKNLDFQKEINYCPLCHSANLKFKFTISQFSPHFQIYECQNCHFQFMNPRFSAKKIASFYTDDYYKGNKEYSYVDERDPQLKGDAVWQKRIKVMQKYQKEGNFLDVGCSFGGLLNSAEKMGFQPYGIDLSEYACRYVQQKLNYTIHQGTLLDCNYQNDFFNIISLIEVIEHVEEPRENLKKCFNLLKENGLLVLQTANMAGQQAKKAGAKYHYYLPGHLSYFSANNIQKTLKEIGFSKVRIYYPVEFGLLPKLKKSRLSFNKLSDYKNWLAIAKYHLAGKIHFKNFALKSSMVIYAQK